MKSPEVCTGLKTAFSTHINVARWCWDVGIAKIIDSTIQYRTHRKNKANKCRLETTPKERLGAFLQMQPAAGAVRLAHLSTRATCVNRSRSDGPDRENRMCAQAMRNSRKMRRDGRATELFECREFPQRSTPLRILASRPQKTVHLAGHKRQPLQSNMFGHP